jgi:hypothetical protein
VTGHRSRELKHDARVRARPVANLHAAAVVTTMPTRQLATWRRARSGLHGVAWLLLVQLAAGESAALPLPALALSVALPRERVG